MCQLDFFFVDIKVQKSTFIKTGNYFITSEAFVVLKTTLHRADFPTVRSIYIKWLEINKYNSEKQYTSTNITNILHKGTCTTTLLVLNGWRYYSIFENADFIDIFNDWIKFLAKVKL